MKKHLSIIAFTILCFGILPVHAQFDYAGGQTMHIGSADSMEKLFGSNQTFSATLEMQVNNGSPIAMSGKMSFDKGSSRTEMDMTTMKGGGIPPDVAAMMKSAGLDRMVTISQSDKKTVYVIYPNAQSYAEMTPPESAVTATNADSKIEITELGKETVAGHPCVKNKAVVTDKQGDKHEFTVWNATDLKNFPVKIEMNEQGSAITISYSDISFSKPDASLFNPPTGYTKYGSAQEMMQAVMMKSLGGGMGIPKPGGQ
jgi:outer membrane lipoprotein-sorting protein